MFVNSRHQIFSVLEALNFLFGHRISFSSFCALTLFSFSDLVDQEVLVQSSTNTVLQSFIPQRNWSTCSDRSVVFLVLAFAVCKVANPRESCIFVMLRVPRVLAIS